MGTQSSTRKQSETNVATLADANHSVLARMAERFGVDQAKMLGTLKDTCFQSDKPITDAQFMALCVVADQYKLNPFTKEIYAYPDKRNGIVPVVGVDGWIRIINEHPQFDGMEFVDSDEIIDGGTEHNLCPAWTEVVIYRKDRSHSTKVTEYFDECYRPPFEKNGYKTDGPWQSHTRRMLRHKALIQGARLAFGFAGIYDQDEAERIIEGEVVSSASATKRHKPHAQEPQQVEGPVTIDQEPEPVQPTLTPQDLNELSNKCVKFGVEPKDLAEQLKVASLAELPLSDVARANDLIEMMAADK
jgi:phage recombination protein Bet